MCVRLSSQAITIYTEACKNVVDYENNQTLLNFFLGGRRQANKSSKICKFCNDKNLQIKELADLTALICLTSTS